MDRLRSRQMGVILVAVSAVLWSTAGLFVRMADLDTWTIVAWRSLFSFLALGGIAVMQNRQQLRRVVMGQGLPGVFAVCVSVVSTISYVLALRLTTVANVMIIYAALPFIATAIAYLWLREHVTVRFLIAGAIAIAGILIMANAATTLRDVAGLAAAFAMTAGFATQLVHSKRHPSLDMTIIIALTAGVCALVTIPFMQTGIPAPRQLLACALFGILTTGLAYVLVLKGGRLITSGEAGFISMLDVILGPLWVWLFFGERPTQTVIGGGVIVLGAVVWYLATDRTQSRITVVEGKPS
jgi:drug/metabolite transporter (DMT)-like permease